MSLPSGAVKFPWNPRIREMVGAMSAEVTGSVTNAGCTWPGPYQNMGTSCVYAHGPACGAPAPRKFRPCGTTMTCPLVLGS
jgi:hypothetical protein